MSFKAIISDRPRLQTGSRFVKRRRVAASHITEDRGHWFPCKTTQSGTLRRWFLVSKYQIDGSPGASGLWDRFNLHPNYF
jgi:hypothetical protein